MADAIRIDLSVGVLDRTEPGLSNIIKKVKEFGNKIEDSGKKVKKTEEYISKFDKTVERTQRNLSQWANETYEVLLEVREYITPVLQNVEGSIRSVSGKTWKVTLKAVDMLTSPIVRLMDLLKNFSMQAQQYLSIDSGTANAPEGVGRLERYRSSGPVAGSKRFDMSESAVMDEGELLGKAFSEGIAENIDFDAIGGKFEEVIFNVLASVGAIESEDGGSPILDWAEKHAPLFDIASASLDIGSQIFRGEFSLANERAGVGVAEGSGVIGALGNAGLRFTTTSIGNYRGILGDAVAGMGEVGMVASGAAGVTGGIIGAKTLISGTSDLYKGFTSDNKEEAKAYKQSGAWKVGSTVTGAAIGTAILPGLGTLIGAGIGGLVGTFIGDRKTEEYEKKAAEEAEKQQLEQAKAEKVLKATGRSIKDVKFSTKELNEAMNDAEVSAEEFAMKYQKAVDKIKASKFGDVKLSLEEVKEIADRISFGDQIESMNKFSEASQNTDKSLESFQSTLSALDKMNWKVNLGIDMDVELQENYRALVEEMFAEAKQYSEDQHYETTLAFKLLFKEDDPRGMKSGIDTMYEQKDKQLEEKKKEYDAIFEDGNVTPEEKIRLNELQTEMAGFINDSGQSKVDKSLEAIKVKYGSIGISEESFSNLLDELGESKKAAEEIYDNGFEQIISANQDRLKYDEKYDVNQYNADNEAAGNAYAEQIEALKDRVSSVPFGIIAQKYSDELDGILPELEGSISEKLQSALDRALTIEPDPKKWEPDDIVKWFGLEGVDQETVGILGDYFQKIANTVPDSYITSLRTNVKESIPSPSQIMQSVDFTQWTADEILPWYKNEDYNSYDFAGKLTGLKSPYINSDKISYSIAETIYENLLNSMDPDKINEFIDICGRSMIEKYKPERILFNDEYYEKLLNEYRETKTIEGVEPIGNIFNEVSLEQMSKGFQEYGMTSGRMFNDGVSQELSNGSEGYRKTIQQSIDSATLEPFSAKIKLNRVFTVIDGTPQVIYTKEEPSFKLGFQANGGFINGKQLSWIGEEGPEAIIPLVPGRRGRALELYERTGEMLGVGANAAGGIIGSGFIPSLSNGSNYEIPEQQSQSIEEYYNSTNPNQAGEVQNRTPVQVNVNMTPEFHISGSEEQSEEDIVQVVKRHIKEMADELGGEIASRLDQVFSNMPLKEA